MCRQAAAFDRADHRAHLLAAHHCQHPEERNGQQEVGNRPGRDDGNALPDGFTIEGLIELIGRNIAFTLVEHFYVAAQRNRCNDKLSALTVMPA